MLMVIFGAGASYDSYAEQRPSIYPEDGATKTSRPPLARQLFHDRFADSLKQFHECKPIVSYLRGHTSIEAKLEELQNEATGTPPYKERLRQLAAVRWYLQVMLSRCDQDWYTHTGGITNYATLLDEIQRWGHDDVLCVTFNYDRLLERTLHEIYGLDFKTTDDYLRKPFAIIKVHGSVNWGRVIRNVPEECRNQPSDLQKIHCLTERLEAIEVTDKYVVARLRATGPFVRSGSGNDMLFPAIAIPVQTKQVFECPEKHLAYLTTRLREVDRLLIIGWGGMDKHFVNVVRERLRREVCGHVVCANDQESSAVVKTLAEAGMPGELLPMPQTFTSYVVDRVGKSLFGVECA